MNILITGGAGYIGTSLIPALALKNEIQRIIILDNLSRNNYSLFLAEKFKGFEKVTFVNGELLDSRNIKKLLTDINVVYHLAARVTTPFANTDAHYFEQVNNWGTAELVYAIDESEVETIIYTSSMGVYGASEENISEESIPNPKTFYGISKLRGEEHLRRLMKNKRVFILRCGNVYGYNRSMRFDAVINKFVFETNFSHRISIHGTGEQMRPFIHIELIKEALVELLFSKTPSGTYNLVYKNLSVMEIVDTLKDLRPDLEFMFINQHIKLRNLSVAPESMIWNFISKKEESSLKNELDEFLGKFSF